MASVMQLLNLRNIGIVFRNISKNGLGNTLRFIFSDLLFDMKYQVETVNTKMLDELEIDSPNKSHGRYYEGTNAFVFKQVFSQVKVDVASTNFVDFGSGKGKVLFMAAEMGFPKVTGVEFSGELVEICRKNLASFRRRSKSKTEFEILHLDAAEYQIPPDAKLLFFSNPFDETLILKVIDNILGSIEKSPREVMVIHLHPQGNMAFAMHPRFQMERELPYGFVFRVKPGHS